MKRQLTNVGILKVLIGLAVIAIAFNSCSEEKFAEQTDDTVNILGYLQNDPENYSEFLKILELTGNDTFIGTYGTYTLFAPTNDAVKMYLEDQGVNSVEDIDQEELEDFVRLHLIEEVILTTDFTDGKIATPTMYGQFLTTGAMNDEGATDFTINKTSKIVQANIEVGNGIIHVIDHVLKKATKSIAEIIAEKDELSIFNEAVRATGWNERLNEPVTYDEDSIPNYLTMFVQTDEVFHEAGINSLSDLIDEYSQTGDPTNPEDSLNLFVAYRILPGLKYTADLVTTPSHTTKAPLEVITVKLSKDTILLNEATFNGVLEKGVVVNREKSDETATNGVLHYVNENFNTKLRLPAPVYFDVADQPEFRQLASIFRKPNNFQEFFPGELQDIQWGGGLYVAYMSSPAGSADAQTWWGDRLEIQRLRTSGGSDWIEFKTPVIIKGRYKVWITYRTHPAGTVAQAKFNGELMSRLVDFREYRNTELPPRVLESQGYKKSLAGSSGNFNSRLLGIVDVETTDRHILRLEALNNPAAPTWIDVIEFRPVDMEQLWPKFASDGSLVNE